MDNMKDSDITIELCGKLADIIACPVTIKIAQGGSTIAQVRRDIAGQYPDLAPHMESPHIKACLDERLVDDNAMIIPKQILAFFPPVSGG